MSDAIFPTLVGLSWPVTKTPQWYTGIQQSVSGREVRRAYRTRPIWKFSLSFEILRNYQMFAEYNQLLAFYNQRRGAFDSFLFLDETDKLATAQAIGVGDGVRQTFPLLHVIQGWLEPIGHAPAPAVTLNGVSTSAFSTDGANVTFTSAPAAGVAIAWSGTFYYRVRFEKDEIDFDQFYKDFWALKRCELVGVI